VIPIRGGRALSLVLLASAIGCRVDQGAFENRVFTCDPAASDPRCGTTASGGDMICFPGSQLDGTDFCAPKCDPMMSLPAGETGVCTSNDAILKTCDPTDTTTPGGPCGRSDFACLRTDVLSNEGVCVNMHPCTQDADCPSPVHSTCAATFLRDMYQGEPNLAADLHLDNLYCLQRGCVANQANCSAGQACLPPALPKGSNAPDICVPECDSQGRCPPNHFCFQKLSGPDNPAVCIPGLLGFECESDIDCLMGTCTDLTGTTIDPGPISPKLCSTTCTSDDDCARYDSVQGDFICATENDGQKHCVTPSAFRGATCRSQAGCTRNPGTICVFINSKDPTEGTCVFPCSATRTCPAYSGVPHTCLPLDLGTPAQPAVCYPGLFSYPCTDDTNCVGGMKCRAPTGSTNPPFCTATCQTDSDCSNDRWIGAGNVCVGSVCVPASTISTSSADGGM
jgi:hypothetical protein